MPNEPVRARNLSLKVFTSATVAQLETDVNTWLQAQEQETVVETLLSNNANSNFFCYIWYTEA